jgi:hypothetical protein
MRNLVVARDPAAARAAMAVLDEGANAVDMALAGMLAGAVRASASSLLGGCALLVLGTGMGRHVVDGRPRAPGVGERRPRTPETPPETWGAAVPGFFQGVCTASARFGAMPLTALARAASAAVREEGSPIDVRPRVKLMEAVARNGLPGLVSAGFVRAALATVGPAEGGLFTEEDLALRPADIHESFPCSDGAYEVFSFPRGVARWSASAPAALRPVPVDAVVACDKQGVFCVGAWLVAPEGPALQGVPGVCLADLLPLPQKGVTRWRPGSPLPFAFPIAGVAYEANVFAAFALSGRGAVQSRGDSLVNARLELIGTDVRVGDAGVSGEVSDAQALWVQRELRGDKVYGDVTPVL